MKGVGPVKVLVHLNHGHDKSYLLTFDRETTPKMLKEILESDDSDQTIRDLIAYSAKQVEIKPKDRRKAESVAHFIVNQRGYGAERLA
jgi:hypothetical protein